MSTSQEIRKNVLDQIKSDSRIDWSNIVVEVSDGKVELSGTVQSLSSMRAAEEAAGSVVNVKEVKNSLKIRYAGDQEQLSDKELAYNVKQALDLDGSINAGLINIEVEDGVVTLSGSVGTYWKKAYCEDVVMGLRDVAMVINKLSVVPTHTLSDNEIAKQVQSALERMAGVDTEYVTVIVNKGKVVLAGKVPHWNAFYASEYAAKHTEGVVDVKNDLLIT